MVSGIGTTGSLSSVQGIEQLVTQMTNLERQRVTSFKTQVDDLSVKKGVYSDVQTKLQAVQTAIDALRGDDGDGGAFNTFTASVTDEDSPVTATVSDSAAASAGNYEVEVQHLAAVDRYASYQFADISTALGMSGSIVLAGAANRHVSGEVYGATPGDDEVNAVSDFSHSSIINESAGEMDSGSYYVEMQNAGTEADPDWQFRVVDSTGTAVSVDDASASGDTMTADWQSMDNVAGKTFNTGRGLKISFESLEYGQSYVAGAFGAGAASVSYTKSGDNITIDVGVDDTLSGIRDKINAASYLDEKAVEASIVDNRLILGTLNEGTESALVSGGSLTLSLTGGTIGAGGLGFFDTTTLEGGITNRHLVTARDAEFTVNGLNITRSSNSIDDVIAGVTLNLNAVSEADSSTTVKVSKDHSDITNKIKEFLTAINAAVKHIKLKTQPQLDANADEDTPTYTAAPLGNDYSIKDLRYGLSSDLLSAFSGATGSLNNLFDVGIEIGDDNVSFELADSSALNDALTEDFAGVTALFDNVLDKLETRLSGYIDSSDGIIARTKKGIEDQIEGVEARKESQQERLARLEEMYRQQFYQMQATLLTMQYQYQNTMLAFGVNTSSSNQLG